jgi:protein-disulfide isomerase
MAALLMRMALTGLAFIMFSACDATPKASVDAPVSRAPDGIGHVIGQDSAPVTLIEYASPTCPACKYFHDDVQPELIKKYVDTGKVKFVYRAFPIHEPDVPAYALALCVSEDKYFAVLDDLFENQQGIVEAAQVGALEAALVTVAARHGIDTKEKFDACMASKPGRDRLAAQFDAAQKDKVGGTPTFVLNGKVYNFDGNFRTVEGISKEIDALLAASGTK